MAQVINYRRIVLEINYEVFITRYDMDTRRKIKEISDDLKRFPTPDPVSTF